MVPTNPARKVQADFIRLLKKYGYKISDGVVFVKDPTGKYNAIAIGVMKLYNYK